MKIDPSTKTPLTNRVESEITQTKKETVAANIKDSFVDAASDKAQLFSHANSQKLNTGSGIVSGLNVSTDQTPSIQIEKGTAVNAAGKLVNAERPSYFDGKKLEPKDLQAEQDYKLDHKRLHGSQIDRGLLSSTNRIAAEFALFSPVINRLCELTGKSAQEMRALLNQYGLNPESLPPRDDQKVMSFIQDPVFAGYPPQEILKALYS